MAETIQKRDTRAHLLAVGVVVLTLRGYNGAGIKEIVDAAGIPKGSFYNYFASKEEFGVAVVEHYAANLLARMDAITADADYDPLTALSRYFAAIADSYEAAGTDDGCLLCNLGAEVPAQSRLIRQAMLRAFDAQQKHLTHILQEAQRMGQVRNDLSTEDLADTLLNSWNGALIRMKNEQDVRPLRQFLTVQVGEMLKG